ncbi:unnamed protein product [Rotaria socialis]
MHSVVSNHEFISSEQLSVNFNSDDIQTNDEQDISISSGLVEEVSFLNTPRIDRRVDPQTSRARSQLRSTYQTSTPNVIYQKREIKTRHRRRSEEGIPHATAANDRALIYDTPLHELHAWLTSNLKDSGLVPLAEAQNFYNQIMKQYNQDEHSFDYTTIRGDILRKQLESQFPDYYHFETVNKRNGTYIALNNVSHYSRAAISLSKSSTLDVSDRQQPTTIISEAFDEDQREKCKIIFDAVRLLRNNMKNTLHLLETLFKEPNKMTELTSDLFADCVPLVIRNFIGLLTSNNRHFKNLENEYNYYDIFKKDLFQTNRKSLKNIAIGYDILNAKHDHIVSPKHILLANEICKHGRSNELMSIMNRFGHAASYKTITRVHRKVANQQIAKSSVPADVLPDCYLVQVADNFDLNRETLHGERSYHFLNRILVQTYENNFKRPMVQLVDNHNQLSSATLSIDGPTTTNFDASDEVSSVNFQQSIDQSTSTHCEDESSINKIRAADEALRDHSMTFYHDFEPFIDNTLNPHLFAYGCIKAYYNRLGINNLPLYSGFMATYLPHAIRPRHKVTFMAPINQDPNKSETAKECMVQMKKMLIDSGLQNNTVLVVDERIFRLCMEVKDEEWLNFQNIFLYPGDFHMMKCGMTVIWGLLEESGIDILIGELYKGATHRAVLSVAHFNKSLRAIKLIFTALHILLHNEFVQSLPTTLIDQFEQCMNKMPSNFTNVDDNQQWYAYVLDFLSNAKLKNVFDRWIDESCEKNLKFRFWTFVLLDLITPLIKLYTALRTSNFSARNAAVCDLAELFFSTNHRQYARLTARHLSDLRVCSQQYFDYLSKSFAVSRSNRNFSTIALDQTIEVTINKMGKGHGGITGRCSTDLIDVWSESYAFRSMLSTITSELAGVESASNSIESHIECSSSRMSSDHVDLQIILNKLVDEKLFSLDTDNKLGAVALKGYIHDRLVNCTTSLSQTLHASSLLHIHNNDSYDSTASNMNKRLKSKSKLDLKKIDAEIRRILLLAQYRSIDLVSVFGHEFCSAPISLCSLEDSSLLNQQSKSKDTFDFLKEKFPVAILTHMPPRNQQQALVIDGSSLLHFYPRAESNVFQYSIYLLTEHIIPLFNDYSRIDIIFGSSKSQDVKTFIKRHDAKSSTQTKYDKILRNYLLPTGKAYQNFVVSNRSRLAAAIVECWKEKDAIQKLPPKAILVMAGPNETAMKLEKDEQPIDMLELESNHVETDSRLILHVDQLIQNGFFNIVVKSIDSDVIILCIYYAYLPGLEKLVVDATLPKKSLKIIDCTYIHNELIDNFGVNPVLLLIVYALSGCDTCSFTRNISKRTFMQTLFEAPRDFTDLENLTVLPINRSDISAVEKLYVRCFSSGRRRRQSTCIVSSSGTISHLNQLNQKNVSINELRSLMAMAAFKKNATSIATSLPPTHDSLFYHCLRVSRQVAIWLQATNGYIGYPSSEESGFQISDGRAQIQWKSKLAFPNDRQLSSRGKHKGKCTRCVCILNQLPCTIFCQCPMDCSNRKTSETATPNVQTMPKPATSADRPMRVSTFSSTLFDYEYSDEEISDESSTSIDNVPVADMNDVDDSVPELYFYYAIRITIFEFAIQNQKYCLFATTSHIPGHFIGMITCHDHKQDTVVDDLFKTSEGVHIVSRTFYNQSK